MKTEMLIESAKPDDPLSLIRIFLTMLHYRPHLIIIGLALSGFLQLKSQPPLVRAFQYIDKYSELAMEQMAINRIPASVIMAQAIFESGSGNSELALKSNNHFGIKCHAWIGDTVIKTDDAENECFRKYSSIRESYIDHSYFLKNRPWYKKLFTLPITDYRAWCYGLKEAGYATYPRYAEELIAIIERNRLYELDQPEKLLMPEIRNAGIPQLRHDQPYYQQNDLLLFVSSGLLQSDVLDIHVRSLDIIVETREEELRVAEN